MVLTYTRSLLEKAGFEVFTHDNIWISSLVRTLQPDFILMDVEFDQFQGTDSVRTLKLTKLGVSSLIYLHSGKSEEQLRDLCEKTKADGFICKAKSGEKSQLVCKVCDALGISNDCPEKELTSLH